MRPKAALWGAANTVFKLLLKLTPVEMLMAGFVAMILLGACLLALPVSSESREFQSFLDALFTSTSAVTTTGLTVVDTGGYYSLFGELVILLLVQVGSLGYMVFFTLIVLWLGKKLSLRGRTLLRESVSRPASVDLLHYVKIVVRATFLIELAGAVLLALLWRREMPLGQAVYQGVFHSISAFNTAGFSLFSDSMCGFRQQAGIQWVINSLALAGGIGFFVLYDIWLYGQSVARRRYPRGLAVHTRMVLATTAALLVAGTGLVYVAESGRDPAHGAGQKLLTASFQVISASTTCGFNTVPISTLSQTSQFVLVILMFIGASPGGTGAGIKTTSFILLILFMLSTLAGRDEVSLLRSRVLFPTIQRAFGIALAAALLVVTGTLVLSFTEPAALLEVLFECVSAFTDTGLSTGITPSLSPPGKACLILLMYFGRIGPLAIGYLLVRRPKGLAFHYPEADVLVG